MKKEEPQKLRNVSMFKNVIGIKLKLKLNTDNTASGIVNYIFSGFNTLEYNYTVLAHTYCSDNM